jgi:hypothetical protein
LDWELEERREQLYLVIWLGGERGGEEEEEEGEEGEGSDGGGHGDRRRTSDLYVVQIFTRSSQTFFDLISWTS